MTRRVLCLVPSIEGTAPGQRFRLEQWKQYLGPEVVLEIVPFETESLRSALYERGHYLKKVAAIGGAWIRRLENVLASKEFDACIIHREAALVGPAILERLIVARGIPLIYDFDDPIWLPYRSPTNGVFSRLKFPGKTAAICRMADVVVVGNRLLAEWASQHAERVEIVPSTVELNGSSPRVHARVDMPTLGWTGSHSTLQFLTDIVPFLNQLSELRRFHLRIISHTDTPAIPGLRHAVQGVAWKAETEAQDVAAIDIGLAPFPDSGWTPWRCHGKILQYMAAGIPTVASNIGIIPDYITDGVNGFLASTPADWLEKTQLLMDDVDLRARMGRAARATIERGYSAEQWGIRFKEIINSTQRARPAAD